jgi:hypothetical protein
MQRVRDSLSAHAHAHLPLLLLEPNTHPSMCG